LCRGAQGRKIVGSQHDRSSAYTGRGLEAGVTAENLVLAVFLAAPLVFGWLALRFFRKQRQRGKSSAATLLAGNALLLALLLSIVVLVGEVYYRFCFDSTDSFGLAKTTRRWFERHIQTNSTGFRDTIDYMRRAPPDKRRVTFLGDSFTAGHGIADVEDRFANRIRAMRPDWEVQVLASLGWDTGHELRIAKRYADQRSETDAIVLVYCLNDIADIVPEWREILHAIYEEWQPGFLTANSYFFNTLHYRWKAARDPQLANYYDFVLKAYEGPVWERQKKRLRTLRDLVDAQGAQLLVVTFPFVHDLGPDYPYRAVHERIDEFWRALGVPQLDLLGVFEAHAGEQLVIGRYDAHPNERANAIAADAIAAFIDANLADATRPNGE